MKKLLLLIIGCILLQFAHAEKLNNAIGLRLGGGNHFSSELSYQHGLNEVNRIEVDLGYRLGGDTSGGLLLGSYQWVHSLKGNFSWYIGFGGQAGFWNHNLEKTSGLALGVLGIVGLEYNFSRVPISLTLDTRPEAYFLYYSHQTFHGGGAFAIRYAF